MAAMQSPITIKIRNLGTAKAANIGAQFVQTIGEAG